mmetsp:Transcript_18623/g.22752  ORF Transcript_18623/g.22752 Transcript_18623/m.22752 type:complete len:84 (+) Transcript_18623:356-607(+)|eukprot:CAMPEP_0204847072 /NCGR_PEP_ID=MMETSP1347-20130617/2457_1 /ASSEMBLY_ACC=CAM_ASM_000690 /TAXON_ID=215587 /ORGANISM="Aplanochytrium stocchinoi, Strain GSBS06" /LENGTH=83 /DNA_ID=CAMNT_0051987877 /DNA_START=244 /DNA_END=495 /DNA_ORIENTATION=+
MAEAHRHVELAEAEKLLKEVNKELDEMETAEMERKEENNFLSLEEQVQVRNRKAFLESEKRRSLQAIKHLQTSEAIQPLATGD